MKSYKIKQKELDELAEQEAHKVARDLIFKNLGKPTRYLREDTLRFINEDHVPSEIAMKLKTKIDEYILSLRIPVQKD